MALQAPGAHIDVLGVLRVDHDMVDDIVVPNPQVSEMCPTASAVGRLENSPRARAQEDVVRIMHVIGETAGVTAVWSQSYPMCGPSPSADQFDKHDKNEKARGTKPQHPAAG